MATMTMPTTTSAVTTKVGTSAGVVTVSGIARTLSEKLMVSKLAGDISGVKSVINNMIIAVPVASK